MLDVRLRGGQRFGTLRGGGLGLRAAVLDGELSGVKLLLKLPVAAQYLLGVRVVGSRRSARRHCGGLSPPTRPGQRGERESQAGPTRQSPYPGPEEAKLVHLC